jgi:hypothetical protein
MDFRTARLLCEDLARTSQAALGGQILALADSPVDFVAALRCMAGDPGRPAAEEREHLPVAWAPAIADHCRAFAERHSWSSRTDTFASVIRLSLSSQDCPDPSLAEREL